MGNKFSRTLRVTNLPSQLNDEFINSATDMSFNCLTTMSYKAIPTRETVVFLMLALKALKMDTINVPVVDGLITKHMD